MSVAEPLTDHEIVARLMDLGVSEALIIVAGRRGMLPVLYSKVLKECNDVPD